MRNLCRTFTAFILAAILTAGTLTFADADARSISYDLNIPSEDLTAALQSFAIASHHKLLYKSELTAGKISRALNGHFTAQEAMEALLSGTGLSYEITGSSVVLIKDQPSGKTSELREEGTPSSPSVAHQSGSGNPILLAQVDQGKDTSDVPVDKSDTQTKNRKTEGLEEIVVTGTHIRGVANDTVPVTTLDRHYIDSTGLTTTAGLIESLPQNFALASQSGISVPGVLDGATAQGEGINLRGIGLGTTLVLVNGRRMAPGFFGTTADISALPLSAIDRVEILTDGASAIYGSDAVGGVVNFILKHDFDGAETNLHTGWARGVTEYRLTQTLGKAWGSGNALFSADYYDRGLLRASDRDFVPATNEIGSLLPKDKDLSLLFSGRQSVTDTMTIFSDDLYTHRDSFNQAGEIEYGRTTSVTDPQFVGTIGIDWAVAGDWQLEASGSYALNDLDSVQSASAGPLGQMSPYSFVGAADIKNRFAIASGEIKGDGTIFTLPNGPVKAAVGVDWRRESFDFSNSPALLPSISKQQNVSSAFAEINVPVVNAANHFAAVDRLTLSIAGRYDRYSTFGSSFDPRFGLMWAPTSAIHLRASWGTSYLAPPLPAYATNENSAVAFTGPDAGVPAGISDQMELAGNNPNSYMAQKASSTTFGVELSPKSTPGLGATLNYYRIDFKDRLATPSNDITTVLSNSAAYNSLITRNPTIPEVEAAIAQGQAGLGFFAFDPNFNSIPPSAFNPASIQVLVDLRQRNLAVTTTSGFDASLHYDGSLNDYKFHAGFDGTYILDLRQQITPSSQPVDLVGTFYNPPRWRGRASLGAQRAGGSANVFLNYTDSYTDNRIEPFTPVASNTTVDARVAYSNPPSAGRMWSGFTVSLSAINLFNRNPPATRIIAQVSDFGFDPTNGNPLGRLISVDVSKKW